MLGQSRFAGRFNKSLIVEISEIHENRIGRRITGSCVEEH